MAQRNAYELTHKDGRKSTVVANSYSDVKRAVHTFCVDATHVQRIYRDGSRGTKQTIQVCFFTSAGARPRAPEFPLYHTPANLSSKKIEKVAQNFFPDFVQLFCK